MSPPNNSVTFPNAKSSSPLVVNALVKINLRRRRNRRRAKIPLKILLNTKINDQVGKFHLWIDYDPKFEQEWDIVNAHRSGLFEIAGAVKRLFQYVLPGANLHIVGSFAAGVDVMGSDVDFSFELPKEKTELNRCNRFKWLIYLKNSIINYTVCNEHWKIPNAVTANIRDPYVIGATVPVLQFIWTKTNKKVDVTKDNHGAILNTQLLIWYRQVDKRFGALCRAVKSWAAKTGVQNSKDGRLNSFSICLMVIHYLQRGVTPAILPNIQKMLLKLYETIYVDPNDYQKLDMLEVMKEGGIRMKLNDSSLGKLYYGFMQYYANFDFHKYLISVWEGDKLEKYEYLRENSEHKKKNEYYKKQASYIFIEDPWEDVSFNCGRTVTKKRVAARIQKEFKIAVKNIKKRHSIIYEANPEKNYDFKKEEEKEEKKVVVVREKEWRILEKRKYKNIKTHLTS